MTPQCSMYRAALKKIAAELFVELLNAVISSRSTNKSVIYNRSVVNQTG